VRTFTSVDLGQLRELTARREFFWLDLSNPDAQTLDQVGDVLKLHELAIEDTQEFGQRPKIDAYGDQLLLVYFGAALDDNGGPVPIEVHIHISNDFVLTVHRERCERFETVRATVEREPAENEELVVYRVIDGLTDAVLDVLEHVAGTVDEYEAQVFHRPKARERDGMAMLRRSLGSFRRLLVTQRQVFPRAAEEIVALPTLKGDVSAYYRDVADHLSRAVDEVETARDNLQGILATYTNEVQERLTIVATIFLPLTVVTGFFGQNFAWMIGHIGAAAAFWGLGVGGIVVSVAIILFWLVRSGLYRGTARPTLGRNPRPSRRLRAGPSGAGRSSEPLPGSAGSLDREPV
jgi:magnesium transporter